MKAKKKKQRRKERRTGVVSENVGGTPETLRHAASADPDPIRAMIDDNSINFDSASEMAADEIRHVYNAVVYQLEARSNRLSHVSHGVKDMAEDLAAAHKHRYLPWSKDIGSILFNLTISMVVNRVGTGSRDLKVAVAGAIQNYARRM